MRRLASTLTVLLAIIAACAGANSASPTQASPAAPAPTPAGAAARAAGGPSGPAWTTYHRTALRAGATSTNIKAPLHHAWTRHLDGAVYGEVLYVEGHLIAATENDSVYALNPSTGQVIWRRHLAKPASESDIRSGSGLSGCGDIFPLGITGTPAYDATTGSVFVVAESRGGHHTLWALNARTGARRWHRSTDVLPGRNRRAEQQRSALLVTHGRVITTYGGLSGDCGNYVGYVTSTATTGTGKTAHYAVPTPREAGMWSPAGPVTGANGNVYVASGNGAEIGGKWDKSDSVTELNPTTLHRIAIFAPSVWRSDNRYDRDLGSSSPIPVPAVHRLVVAGKNGHIYLLKPSLAGIGSSVASTDNCGGGAFGGAARKGRVVVMPCKSGILALRVRRSGLHRLWSANGIYASPVIAGAHVLAADLNSDSLKVISLKRGHVQGSASLSPLTHFPSESTVGHEVYVGTLDGVSALRGS
ncbi:MAG TPA: PQQ-binding-like beta-propeller repeat protein [Mycobacteriales bacterium]|nr:PQQ-binding-like beta-propeller repeat protein [Mycobacteriales bacterium]